MAKIAVAPYVGAWIEILLVITCANAATVAPFVGAWIEICMGVIPGSSTGSLPLWERGLK